MRPRGEDDAYTILLDPSRTERTSAGTSTVPLEEGVARAIDYYREFGIAETYTHLRVGRMTESVARRSPRPRRRRRRLRRLQPRARRCSSETPARDRRRRQPALRRAREPARRRRRSRWSRARSPTTSVLARLPGELDYVFHLATYHGNQSSMADPLADHEHNTYSTLQLFEAIKDVAAASRRVVYASAGCTVAEKTFDGAEATTEDAPVSLWLDSPYQISKIIGEFYSNYYFTRHGLPTVKARFQNVYGPGEILGAGRWRGTVNTVWRNVVPDVRLQGAPPRGAAGRERRASPRATSSTSSDMAQGLIACATARRARRGLQPGERRRDLDPRARRADQRADRQPDADRAHPGARLGPLRASATAAPTRRADAARLRGRRRAARRTRAHDRLDAREPRLDRALHRQAPRADARAASRLSMEAGSSRAAARDRAADAVLAARAVRELWEHRDLLYLLARREVVGPLQAVGDRRRLGGAAAAAAGGRVQRLLRPSREGALGGRGPLPGVRGVRDGAVAVLRRRDVRRRRRARSPTAS